MSAFLAMGGYAVYVWSSYAVAFVALAAIAAHAALRARARRAELGKLRERLGDGRGARRRRP